MSPAYETPQLTEAIAIPEREPDFEGVSEYGDVADESYIEAFGQYRMRLWNATEDQPEFVQLTETEPAQTPMAMSEFRLIYEQAENFYLNTYNTPIRGYFEHLGINATYDERVFGGSEVALTYPDIGGLNQVAEGMDGQEPNLKFVPFENGSYDLETFLSALSKGEILMSTNGWTRPHDVFFHAGAWLALGPDARQIIFDRAGDVLQKYQSVKPEFDIRNEEHRQAKTDAELYMHDVDDIVNNYALMKNVLKELDRQDIDEPAWHNDLGRDVLKLTGLDGDDPKATELRREVLSRVQKFS